MFAILFADISEPTAPEDKLRKPFEKRRRCRSSLFAPRRALQWNDQALCYRLNEFLIWRQSHCGKRPLRKIVVECLFIRDGRGVLTGAHVIGAQAAKRDELFETKAGTCAVQCICRLYRSDLRLRKASSSSPSRTDPPGRLPSGCSSRMPTALFLGPPSMKT